MPDETIEGRARASLARHGLAGLTIAAVLIGGLGFWSATTEIAGAVVASGTVVVEGGAQRIQHQEGGIVSQILVKNDDLVEQGQLLLRLDGTSVEASLAVIQAQLDDGLSRRSRLAAEADGSQDTTRPEVPGWSPGPQFGAMLAEQQKLLAARSASLSGQKAQLDEQTAQVRQQILGLAAQRLAYAKQLAILTEEWEGLEELMGDGLTELSRVNQNKNQRAGLEGEIARIDTDVAAARASIAERTLQASQLVDEFKSKALEELQQVNVSIAELLQQKIAAEDRLKRLEVRSPHAGVVHESKTQTIGGVVAGGETLMLIVPESAEVLVDARVSPMDIDKVHAGQEVVLRLSSLDSRLTPELFASVRGVSPATLADPVTGATYYNVRIAVDREQLSRLPARTHLVPGMPSEVFIETGDRTVLAYLMKPLVDQVMHTFRED